MASTRRPVQVARFSFAAGRQQQEAHAQGHGLGYEVAAFLLSCLIFHLVLSVCHDLHACILSDTCVPNMSFALFPARNPHT